jgi:hypothetical protein
MGKRELLLIAVFLVVGVVIYQATAPPAGPDDRGLSFSKIVDKVRREVRGNRASTEITRTSTEAIAAEITEIRVLGWIAELELVGESRPDVATSLRVRSAAYDNNEAKQYAEETRLVVDRAGNSLTLRVKYPEGRHTGRQWSYLTLKVPARLLVRTEGIGKAGIANVAGVEMTNSRGETSINGISGRTVVNHRGGTMSIADVGSLRWTGRNTELKVAGVKGDTSILIEQGGELIATKLAGAIDVESRNADVRLDDLRAARGPIRLNVNGGSAKLGDIRTDTRVDGRRAELDISIAAAAPIAIYNEGDDIRLTPPPGGFRLDAVVIEGRIESKETLDQLGVELEGSEASKETRAAGAVGGGGPTITVRATRGNLTIRPRTAQGK